MSDGSGKASSGRRPHRRRDTPYDRTVRTALCAAAWTAKWSTYAATLEPNVRGDVLATVWINVVDPRPRLLRSLSRLDCLLGGGNGWYVVGAWPSVDSPAVLRRSSATVIGILSHALYGEARVIADVFIASE